MIKNPLLILAIAISALSAYFNINSWCSDLHGVMYLLAAAVLCIMSFFLFYIARDIARQAGWTWGKVLKITVASILFVISVVGAGTFWMTTQNSDYMKLTAAKSAKERLYTQMVVAQAIRDNCKGVKTKCEIPRSVDYETAKNAYNLAANEYEQMTAEQAKSESVKLTTKIFCLDAEYFAIYRALLLSLLFEIAGIYFCLKSDLKPQDKRSEDKITALYSRTDLTDDDLKVLECWIKFNEEGKILPSGMPAVMTYFTNSAYGSGSQGGTWNNKAINSLKKMRLIK